MHKISYICREDLKTRKGSEKKIKGKEEEATVHYIGFSLSLCFLAVYIYRPFVRSLALHPSRTTISTFPRRIFSFILVISLGFE